LHLAQGRCSHQDGAVGLNHAVGFLADGSCAINIKPFFKALSGIGRMHRFGGTPGSVYARFRRFEFRSGKLIAMGAWFCFALLMGQTFVETASAQKVTYIHTDSLGSVVARTDANGNVSGRIANEPYGLS